MANGRFDTVSSPSLGCARMHPLEVETDERDAGARIALRGELDLFSAKALEEELARLEPSRPDVIVLDLRELSFIDSSGLRVLLAADGRARDQHRRFVLVRAPEGVQRIFSIAGLDSRLAMVDDPAEVL
jgi:anti-anti-sigma factor